MQSSNLDEKQIKNLSKYIDLEDGEETLTARRYFTDTDSCKKIQLKKRKDTGEIDYTNSTGIDAPFKSLFNPTLFKATDTPNAILDFSGSRMLGKLIAYETQGFLIPMCGPLSKQLIPKLSLILMAMRVSSEDWKLN